MLEERHTKACPRCGYTVGLETTVCEECGRWFRATDPDRPPAAGPWLLWVVVGLLIALFLAVTNPTEDDLARWASNNVHRARVTEREPSSETQMLGATVGEALAPAAVRAMLERTNYAVFSVFRLRPGVFGDQGGDGLVLGICGQFVVVSPDGNAEER